jgi:hypothetical protein
VAIALGDEARFQGAGRDPAPAQEVEGRSRLRFVEADQHLARRDAVAVAHQDSADDAPFQMLGGLALGLDADHPGGEGGAF